MGMGGIHASTDVISNLLQLIICIQLHFLNTEVFTSKFYMCDKLVLKHTTFEMTVTNIYM